MSAGFLTTTPRQRRDSSRLTQAASRKSRTKKVNASESEVLAEAAVRVGKAPVQPLALRVSAVSRVRANGSARLWRTKPREGIVRYYLRFWRWVAVFACSMLNRTLWDEQSTYVVTQNGPRRGEDPYTGKEHS